MIAAITSLAVPGAKRLLKFVLKRALKGILKDELSLEQFELNIGQGSVQFTDLEINVDALNQTLLRGSKVKLVSGVIKSATVQVSYSNILHDSFRFEIEKLAFVLQRCDTTASDDIKTPTNNQIEASKYSLRKKGECEGAGIARKGVPVRDAVRKCVLKPNVINDDDDDDDDDGGGDEDNNDNDDTEFATSTNEHLQNDNEGLDVIARWVNQITQSMVLSIAELQITYENKGVALALQFSNIQFLDTAKFCEAEKLASGHAKYGQDSTPIQVDAETDKLFESSNAAVTVNRVVVFEGPNVQLLNSKNYAYSSMLPSTVSVITMKGRSFFQVLAMVSQADDTVNIRAWRLKASNMTLHLSCETILTLIKCFQTDAPFTVNTVPDIVNTDKTSCNVGNEYACNKNDAYDDDDESEYLSCDESSSEEEADKEDEQEEAVVVVVDDDERGEMYADKTDVKLEGNKGGANFPSKTQLLPLISNMSRIYSDFCNLVTTKTNAHLLTVQPLRKGLNEISFSGFDVEYKLSPSEQNLSYPSKTDMSDAHTFVFSTRNICVFVNAFETESGESTGSSQQLPHVTLSVKHIFLFEVNVKRCRKLIFCCSSREDDKAYGTLIELPFPARRRQATTIKCSPCLFIVGVETASKIVQLVEDVNVWMHQWPKTDNNISDVGDTTESHPHLHSNTNSPNSSTENTESLTNVFLNRVTIIFARDTKDGNLLSFTTNETWCNHVFVLFANIQGLHFCFSETDMSMTCRELLIGAEPVDALYHIYSYNDKLLEAGKMLHLVNVGNKRNEESADILRSNAALVVRHSFKQNHKLVGHTDNPLLNKMNMIYHHQPVFRCEDHIEFNDMDSEFASASQKASSLMDIIPDTVVHMGKLMCQVPSSLSSGNWSQIRSDVYHFYHTIHSCEYGVTVQSTKKKNHCTDVNTTSHVVFFCQSIYVRVQDDDRASFFIANIDNIYYSKLAEISLFACGTVDLSKKIKMQNVSSNCVKVPLATIKSRLSKTHCVEALIIPASSTTAAVGKSHLTHIYVTTEGFCLHSDVKLFHWASSLQNLFSKGIDFVGKSSHTDSLPSTKTDEKTHASVSVIRVRLLSTQLNLKHDMTATSNFLSLTCNKFYLNNIASTSTSRARGHSQVVKSTINILCEALQLQFLGCRDFRSSPAPSIYQLASIDSTKVECLNLIIQRPENSSASCGTLLQEDAASCARSSQIIRMDGGTLYLSVNTADIPFAQVLKLVNDIKIVSTEEKNAKSVLFENEQVKIEQCKVDEIHANITDDDHCAEQLNDIMSTSTNLPLDIYDGVDLQAYAVHLDDVSYLADDDSDDDNELNSDWSQIRSPALWDDDTGILQESTAIPSNIEEDDEWMVLDAVSNHKPRQNQHISEHFNIIDTTDAETLTRTKLNVPYQNGSTKKNSNTISASWHSNTLSSSLIDDYVPAPQSDGISAGHFIKHHSVNVDLKDERPYIAGDADIAKPLISESNLISQCLQQRVTLVGMNLQVDIISYPNRSQIDPPAQDFPSVADFQIPSAQEREFTLLGVPVFQDYVTMLVKHVQSDQSRTWTPNHRSALINPLAAYHVSERACRHLDRLVVHIHDINASYNQTFSSPAKQHNQKRVCDEKNRDLAKKYTLTMQQLFVADYVNDQEIEYHPRESSKRRIPCLSCGSSGATGRAALSLVVCAFRSLRPTFHSNEQDENNVRIISEHSNSVGAYEYKQQSHESDFHNLEWNVDVCLDIIKLSLRIPMLEYLVTASSQLRDAQRRELSSLTEKREGISANNARAQSPSLLFFNLVNVHKFGLVLDFVARQTAYDQLLPILRQKFKQSILNLCSNDKISTHDSVGKIPLNIFYWIPTIRGVKLSIPEAPLENCYGLQEVLEQWLSVWAHYLLREDLVNIAASIAIGLAGYSGADSLESVQTVMKQMREKIQRML